MMTTCPFKVCFSFFKKSFSYFLQSLSSQMLPVSNWASQDLVTQKLRFIPTHKSLSNALLQATWGGWFRIDRPGVEIPPLTCISYAFPDPPAGILAAYQTMKTF